jgi:predicted nuclease of predicted toxin-antitoxin system
LCDADQALFARENNWAIVTFDSDFIAMARKELQRSGIVWCAERKYSIGQLVKALSLLHALTNRDTMRNHVEFL